MALTVVPPSPMTLGEVSVAATVAVGFLIPLCAQLDLAIFGQFGLGALQFDLSAEFNAALAVSVGLQISVSNPIASFQAALAGILQLQAELELALSLGLPTISVQVSAQISASLALTASLALKLGGISALIQAALSIKIPALQFIGELSASLSAGPIDVLAFGFDTPMTAAEVGAAAETMFQALPGILPTDEVSGIMIVTKDPAASIAIGALFKIV